MPRSGSTRSMGQLEERFVARHLEPSALLAREQSRDEAHQRARVARVDRAGGLGEPAQADAEDPQRLVVLVDGRPERPRRLDRRLGVARAPEAADPRLAVRSGGEQHRPVQATCPRAPPCPWTVAAGSTLIRPAPARARRRTPAASSSSSARADSPSPATRIVSVPPRSQSGAAGRSRDVDPLRAGLRDPGQHARPVGHVHARAEEGRPILVGGREHAPPVEDASPISAPGSPRRPPPGAV